jgi:hypothetical protein
MILVSRVLERQMNCQGWRGKGGSWWIDPNERQVIESENDENTKTTARTSQLFSTLVLTR